MLRATAFPAPYNSVPVLSGTHTCHSMVATRVIYSRSSLISRFVFRESQLPRGKSLRAVRSGGLLAAAAKKQGRGGDGLAGMEGDFDNEYEDVGYEYVDDEEEEGEDDYDDDDGEEVLLFEDMEKWFAKKPKGFGEGKEYDTSVEDKLLEEMRQNSEAQGANLKRLKSNPVKSASKNNVQKNKDAEVVMVGSRVRLVNLPKKKNIHRDLKSAFEGIPGILDIVPAVTGNKKTRDPICKGFAFVDFKHEKDAVRFVELYTGQTITFGKIQKQIKCELLNAQSSSSSHLELSKNVNTAPHVMVSAFEEDSNEDSDMDDSAFGSWDGTDLGDSDEQQESDRENGEFATALKVDCEDSVVMRIDFSETNSLPSEQVNRNPIAEQKSSTKARQENAPKKKLTSKKIVKKVLDVPGSAKRLKVKEKAVLNDVFSKYGSKAALASNDS